MSNDIKNLFTWWRRFKGYAIAILIISLTGGIIFGGVLLFLIGGPPIIEKTINDANAINIEGDRINILYDTKNLNSCPLTTIRYLWTYYNYKDERIKIFIPLGDSITSISSVATDTENKYILSLPLPAGLWSGDWFYYARTINQCSQMPWWLKPQIRETFNIALRIQNNNNNVPTSPSNIKIVPQNGQ